MTKLQDDQSALAVRMSTTASGTITQRPRNAWTHQGGSKGNSSPECEADDEGTEDHDDRGGGAIAGYHYWRGPGRNVRSVARDLK